MTKMSIATKVAKKLAGASRQYLEDIVSHGIHNLTNDFHGETDAEYREFAKEFKEQAKAGIAAMDDA